MEHAGEFSGLLGSWCGCGRGGGRVEATFPERLRKLADSIRSGTTGCLRSERLLHGGAVRHGSSRGARFEQLLEIAGTGFWWRRRSGWRRARLEHASELAWFLGRAWCWRCRRRFRRLKHFREFARFGFGLRRWRWRCRWRSGCGYRGRLKHPGEFAGLGLGLLPHGLGGPDGRGALRTLRGLHQTIGDHGALGGGKQFHKLLVENGLFWGCCGGWRGGRRRWDGLHFPGSRGFQHRLGCFGLVIVADGLHPFAEPRVIGQAVSYDVRRSFVFPTFDDALAIGFR